jgi:hypothetical protein
MTEITIDMFDSTCKNQFKEKIDSYCYVATALLGGLIIYHTYLTIHAIVISRFTNKPQTVTIINDLAKQTSINQPRRVRNEDSKQRDKDTKDINKELRIVFHQICLAITYPSADDAQKVEVIKGFIAGANPVIKRDINCNLIGSNVLALPAPTNTDDNHILKNE